MRLLTVGVRGDRGDRRILFVTVGEQGPTTGEFGAAVVCVRFNGLPFA